MTRLRSSSSAIAANSDLTPPEERQARRRRRWLILGLALVVLLGGTIYFAAGPVGRNIRSWQSRRTARAAFALVESGRFAEATAKARDAYQLSNTEPEAWRAIGHLLSRAKQGDTALVWWKKVEEAGRLTRQDRRDYAEVALNAGQLTTAAAQVDRLLGEQAGPAPGDMLLAGQVAAGRRNNSRALQLAEKVMADSRASPNELFAGAVLALSVVSHNSPVYRRMWDQIAQWAQDLNNPASLEALVLIAKQPPASATVSRTELAKLLETHPKARPYHQLLAYELRALQEPKQAEEYVGEAVKRYAAGDDETILALCAWLYGRSHFDLILQVLPLERALTRKELFMQHIDALAASGRLKQVTELLSSERFPLDPMVVHMCLATVRSRLGETKAAANAWERALESANDPAKLLALGEYAEKHNATEIADQAYAAAIKNAPDNRVAHYRRLQLAEAAGNTAKLQKLATELFRIWPDDEAARNDEAYLRLLLGASGNEAEKLEKQAMGFWAQEPENWAARATVGLARLRLGRGAEALSALSEPAESKSQEVPPRILVLRAAALAATGMTDEARDKARALSTSRLLPEEQALIAPLLRDGTEIKKPETTD